MVAGWCAGPFQMRTDPGPVVGERIGTGAMGAWVRALTRQGAQPLILPDSADAHAGPRRREFLGDAFRAFAFHQEYLGVGFHGVLLQNAMVGQDPRNRQR